MLFLHRSLGCIGRMSSKPCHNQVKSFRRLMSTSTSTLKHPGLLYKVLKVEPESTVFQIKLKYYRACQQYHPDHGGSVNEFMAVNKAYQILTNDKQRSAYNNLDNLQHKEFESLWTHKFNANRTKIEEVEKYLKDRQVLGFGDSWGQSVMNSVVNFVASKVKNHYQGLIVFDQKKHDECHKLNHTRHIYFILDASSSMFNWDSTHPTYRTVPSRSLRNRICDGVQVGVVEIEHRFHHIIEECKYFNQCVKNFKAIHKSLKAHTSAYTNSCMIFSRGQTQLWTYLPVSEIEDSHFTQLINSSPSPQDFTHIYDTLKFAIANTEKISTLAMTTFMLFTDGADFKSQCDLDELIELIRAKGNINLIILTSDVKSCRDLQKIVDSAKSGRLLKIGDRTNQYGFESVEKAFSSAKDLILSDGYVSFIDLRQTFDL